VADLARGLEERSRTSLTIVQPPRFCASLAGGLLLESMQVLHSWRAALRGRPWIAVAAAYVIALQTLLTGIVGAHVGADAALSDQAFVICHSTGGSNQDDGSDKGSGKSSADHALCALCTLARAAPAILPVDHAVAPRHAIIVATIVALKPSEAVAYDLSVGHAARGPPTAAGSVG
jgi:hypothetical protein